MTEFLGEDFTQELVNQEQTAQQVQDKQNNPQSDANERGDDEIVDEEMEEDKEPEWITVSRIRRYRASIAAENVEGDNYTKKIKNVNAKISGLDDFMGCKITYIQNKAHICAIFGQKTTMEHACTISLFEDNDFKLTPFKTEETRNQKKKQS